VPLLPSSEEDVVSTEPESAIQPPVPVDVLDIIFSDKRAAEMTLAELVDEREAQLQRDVDLGES